jgi:hypothetical protein
MGPLGMRGNANFGMMPPYMNQGYGSMYGNQFGPSYIGMGGAPLMMGGFGQMSPYAGGMQYPGQSSMMSPAGMGYSSYPGSTF